MSYNWKQFTLRIPVNATIQQVYTKWGTSEGLVSWFLREAAFTTNEGAAKPANELLRPGDSYVWRWYGYDDEVTEQGTVLLANHTDELSFSFGRAGNVKVKIYSFKNVTICELEQYDIPTDEQSIINYHLGCMKGWLFYMTNLKSILEGGIDLRNRDVEITQVITS